MSPHYLESDWCAQERAWWLEAQADLELNPEGRIAVARIWPSEETWPGELTDGQGEPLLGFTLYDRETPALQARPYAWPDPKGASGPFRDALLEMAGSIGQKLNALKSELEDRRRREAEADRLLAADGQVIYLHARE